MKFKMLVSVAAAALVAGPASAASFVFTAPGLTVSFSLPDSPIPAFTAPGQGFIAPSVVGVVNGANTVLSEISFLNANYNFNPGISGGFSYDGSVANVFQGIQLYSGTEDAPTFVAGAYELTQYLTGAAGTLVISDVAAAVPEPSAWALLILGFGLAGAAMRRRQTVSIRYA